MENVEFISRYIPPPKVFVFNLPASYPLLVKLMLPSNVSVLLLFAKMAPPCMAKLLSKLLVPVKLSVVLLNV